jgi:hypothetical protein
MKKSYLAVVLTLTCVLGVVATAHAHDSRGIVVNVPFEFVAGARMLPAGTYSVERISPDSDSALVIRGYDNSVLLLPVAFDAVSGEPANVRFEQVGNKHFLKKVETPTGAYTIAISRRMANSVMVNSDGTLSPSGAN